MLETFTSWPSILFSYFVKSYTTLKTVQFNISRGNNNLIYQIIFNKLILKKQE
jgi:hypothetical protein